MYQIDPDQTVVNELGGVYRTELVGRDVGLFFVCLVTREAGCGSQVILGTQVYNNETNGRIGRPRAPKPNHPKLFGVMALKIFKISQIGPV